MNNIDFDKALNLIEQRVLSWVELALTNLPNLVVAVTVFMVFTFLANLTKKVFLKSISKKTVHESLRQLLASSLKLAIIVLGLFIALGILNLDKTVTSLLAGVGVIGLALGFAFQDIAANFVSGVMIAFKQPYKIGDIVEVGGHMGDVESIGFRTTSLTTFEGIEIFIPNKMMFTEPLMNYTTTDRRRLDLEVGVSYGDNLREVEKIVVSCLESLEGRITTEDIQFYYKEFAGSSINFDVRIWIKYPANGNFLKTRHEAIMRIKEALDENNISIPFPIRTLDFGAKGGESLDRPLNKVFTVSSSKQENIYQQ